MQLQVQGQSVYCYTGGKKFDATLPTVVFLHGAQCDHSVWILQTRYFAHHGYSVLAVDLPGHARSAGAALTSIGALADWTLALLDAAGVTQASVVGHSMGALIALESAARAPTRVTRLALVGFTYPMKVSQVLLDAARDDVNTAIDMVNIWQHSSIAQKPSCPGPGFYVMGSALRLMRHVATHNPEKVFYIDFSVCNDYTNGEAAASAVTCPVLFLLADRDQMTPVKAARGFAASLPQAKVVVVERSGHMLMAEQPDAVLEQLFRFMSG